MKTAPLLATFVTVLGCLAGISGATAENPVPIDEEPKHRLVFRNSHVRFFNVQIPPGYRSLMHVHHHDGVFVNIAPSETEAEDWGAATVRRPGRTPGETYFIGYASRPKAHRVSNVGGDLYHVTDTEILQGCGARSLDDTMAGPLILENDRVRVTRIELPPGASTTLYGPCGMFVAVTAGEMTFAAPGGKEQVSFEASGFKWREGQESMLITNSGSAPMHAVDILVK